MGRPGRNETCRCGSGKKYKKCHGAAGATGGIDGSRVPRDYPVGRVVDALKLAAPFCIAARYDNGLAHCIEASVSGATVLRRFGFEAHAVPCAIMVQSADRATGSTVGLGPRDLYGMLRDDEGPLPSFEDWLARQSMPPEVLADPNPAHMVVRASGHGAKFTVDLTLGQVRHIHGIDVGMTDSWPSWDWCSITTPRGWQLKWIEHPRPADVLAVSEKFTASGLAGDLSDLTMLALQCDLNFAVMTNEMQRQLPDVYALAVSRLTSYLGAPLRD